MSQSGMMNFALMRAVLSASRPNTYYGQWLGKNPSKRPVKIRAIAHNGFAARKDIHRKWISPKRRYALWAMEGDSPPDFPAEKSWPLPVIGVRGSPAAE